jgi:apolipoprotein D and lipocalin family protein
MLVKLLILTTLALATQAKFVWPRFLGCPPKPPTVPDFEAGKYVGYWYQITGTPSFFQPSGTSCVRATYAPRDDGSISVRNVAFSPENEFTQICGYADVPDVSEPGALSVHFPGAPAGSYWVIGTDYENYASIYSCKSFLVFNLEYSWVLVRDPANVTPEIKQAALKAFTDNGLSLDNFEDTVQSNCTYEDPNVPPCKTED